MFLSINKLTWTSSRVYTVQFYYIKPVLINSQISNGNTTSTLTELKRGSGMHIFGHLRVTGVFMSRRHGRTDPERNCFSTGCRESSRTSVLASPIMICILGPDQSETTPDLRTARCQSFWIWEVHQWSAAHSWTCLVPFHPHGSSTIRNTKLVPSGTLCSAMSAAPKGQQACADPKGGTLLALAKDIITRCKDFQEYGQRILYLE